MSMSLSSPPLSVPILSVKSSPSLRHPQALNLLLPKRTHLVLLARSVENGAGVAVEVNGEEGTKSQVLEEKGTKRKESFGSNGATVASEALKEEVVEVKKWSDPRWVAGTWDLEKFKSGGKTDWDAVIDAEVRRRKWLQDYPETSSNDNPVVFDTSIIPWWCWVKRFHLPEAELLNGRAAMVGFFMAYFVDSLTGLGLVDQMGNFFCKTLLLIAVVGVLFVRNNQDIETLKKLFEETTFYDKQWQATWQDDKHNLSGKK